MPLVAMSASLIGPLGSSTFRLSTNAVSMSLAGSCFSSESAPWKPFHHGDSEEKQEPASDIDTALVDSLKVLDPKGPIREADIATSGTPITPMATFRENDHGVFFGFQGGGTTRQRDTIYSPAERVQSVSRTPNDGADQITKPRPS